MLKERLRHHKHSLKIWFKSKHFPGRYRRKREWVFFETQWILRHMKSSHLIVSLVHIYVFIWFLRATAYYAKARICYRNSVCLDVWLSHGWISQKRL